MGMLLQSERFPRPENESRIMAAWERFHSGESCNSDALRRLIDDSWRRSQSGHVDPDRNQAPLVLSEDSLHLLLEKQDELLTAGAPVMADARQFLDATGTVIVLATTDGVILNLEGDPSTFGAAERIHLLPGGCWNETVCGTNAVGTALAVGHPVQIHGAEHYCSGIQPWTCSATVIRDPYNNEILGVINVSGLNSTYNRHSLALVMTTASRIESRLARREMELRYHLLERCMSRMTSATGDGVIILDRRGHAIKASDTAEAALRALGEHSSAASTVNLSNLRISPTVKSELPAKLPAWINRDWLEPIVDQGQRLGSLLTIPYRGARTAPRRDEEGGTRSPFLKNAAFERVVGKAPALLEVVSCAQRLAKSNVPVLLLGETGVGKDVFARAIHETGALREGPFVALNCGGFSRELLTSELFGYVEGSFTGARRGGMIGKIEAANGGTLFLDEIGEMPLDLQPHFLRVLEDGAIYRLGENKARKVTFRLVAATNRDLLKEVAEGRFRMDLFYRIAVASLSIPPLRDRAEDVESLADFLLDKLALQHALPRPELDPEALACMNRYAWPGNIRELRNVLERALLMSPGPVLTRDALPAEVRTSCRIAPPRVAAMPSQGELKHLEQVEKETIISMIERQRGNMTAVARELGIAKSTLYVKLKKFDIALSGGTWVDVGASRQGSKPGVVFPMGAAPRVLNDA